MSELARSVLSRSLLPASIAIYLTVALSAFEGLAVSAALPEVAGDLGGVNLLPWVITVYLLASGVATVVAGPLIDAVGVRAMFRWAVVIFAIAGFLGGFAPSLELLIGLRLVQGIGGGFIFAIGLAAVSLVYPEHLIGRAFAANSIVWGVMGVAGPAIAALLLTFASWRWVFLINLPLGMAALAAGWRTLPGPVGTAERRVDARGALALTVVTGAMLLAVDSLGVRSIGWILMTLAVGWLYVRHARSDDRPLLRIEHIAVQPYVGLAVGVGLLLAGAFAFHVYTPLYVRAGRAASPALTAWSVLFFTIGWTAGAVVGSRILDRRAESAVMLGGFSIALPSMATLTIAAAVNAPLWFVFAAATATGVGVGAATNAALTLLRASAPAGEIGRIAAAHQFARNQGFTIGAAIGGSVLLAVVGSRVGDVEVVRELLGGSAANPPEAAAAAIRAGFAISAGIGLLVAVVGLAFVLRMRVWLAPARLRKVGGAGS